MVCATEFLSRTISGRIFAQCLCLITPIPAIIISIASESAGNAFASVPAFEHPFIAWLVTISFITAIPTIILAIAHLEWPSAIVVAALEFTHRANSITYMAMGLKFVK